VSDVIDKVTVEDWKKMCKICRERLQAEDFVKGGSIGSAIKPMLINLRNSDTNSNSASEEECKTKTYIHI
jgi:hypothetical protein